MKQEQDEPEVRPEVPLSPAQWLSQRTTAGGASNCGLWLLGCGELTSLCTSDVLQSGRGDARRRRCQQAAVNRDAVSRPVSCLQQTASSTIKRFPNYSLRFTPRDVQPCVIRCRCRLHARWSALRRGAAAALGPRSPV